MSEDGAPTVMTERDGAVEDRAPLTGRGSADDSDAGGRTFSPGVIVRMQYAAYLFMGFVACIIVKASMGTAFAKVGVIKAGCEYFTAGTGDSSMPGAIGTLSKAVQTVSVLCSENTVVYRISFALTVFYAIHFVSVSDLTCCLEASAREELQRRFFCVKTSLLSLLFTAVFWIPNGFFAAYAWICMFASAVFLVIQMLLIVDFTYQWNEEWGRRAEGNGKWNVYLLLVAGGCYLFGLVLIIVSYVKFVPHEDCNLNGAAVTATLLAGVAYTVVAVWVPHGSIVPSSIVFAYTSTIVFLALRETQDPYCNSEYTAPGQQSWRATLLGGLVSGLAIAYSVVSSGGASSRAALSTEDSDAPEDDPDASGHLASYCYFYVIMMAGSMYLAMVVTNWSVSGGSTSVSTSTAVAVWVKLASGWLVTAMYFWSLLAPYFCCKDRDYGYDVNWQ